MTTKEPKPEWLEKEKQKLAYIPETATVAALSLRKKPTVLREAHLEQILLRYDFYDSERNVKGSFRNDLVDNGDGTVTDRSTGLMWQKGGSPKALSRRQANTYTEELKRNRFAGYRDWRLPTTEEFASLLQRDKVKGRHMSSVFESRQQRCWCADTKPVDTSWIQDYDHCWIVNFADGKISKARWVPGGASSTSQPWRKARQINPDNWVKAVRSMK